MTVNNKIYFTTKNSQALAWEFFVVIIKITLHKCNFLGLCIKGMGEIGGIQLL